MPITSAFVEQYAQWGAKLVYASENGVTFGKPSQDKEVFDIPPRYCMPAQPAKSRTKEPACSAS